MKENSKQENSAISSWAGYIYQGCCALYHALKLMSEDEQKYSSYFLYLDAFEDFTINDENHNIVSLHQCKLYKHAPNYTEIFQQMADTRDYHVNAHKCDKTVPLYFHHNHQCKTTNGIVQYKYKDDRACCDADEIIDEILGKVKEINKGCSHELITDRLLRLVQNKVLEICSEYQNSQDKNIKLWKQARKPESAIPLLEIFNIVNGDGITGRISVSEMCCLVKTRMIAHIEKLIEGYIKIEEKRRKEKKDAILWNRDNAEKLSDYLGNLDDENLEKFIRRINPHIKIASTIQSLADIYNANSIEILFNVLTSCKDNIDCSKYDWYDRVFGKQSPSTIGGTKDLMLVCADIYENRANIDVLYDYRYIVGDTKESTADIYETAKDITNTTDEEGNNCFLKTNKVGILSICDKNNKKEIKG